MTSPYVDMPAIERRIVALDHQLDAAQVRIAQVSDERLAALSALRQAEARAAASLTDDERRNGDSRRYAVAGHVLAEQERYDRAESDLKLAREVSHNIRVQINSAQTMSANFREQMRSLSLGRTT